MRTLTTTSYALLGLLAIKPWSTYELTKQMARSVGHMWPRAESNLYAESKRLVEDGLAVAEKRPVGRRRRTEYRITDAGRERLVEWLSTPSRPTRLESEGLVKVLFGNYGSKDAMLRHLADLRAEADELRRWWIQLAGEYLDGHGLFPERLNVNVLFVSLLFEMSKLRVAWADWAIGVVESWPDASGPREPEVAMKMLAELTARPTAETESARWTATSDRSRGSGRRA